MRWHYRLQLPESDASDAAVTRVVTAAGAQFPDAGWDTRTRTNASPSLEQDVERFTQYLHLVGLTALLVGGVGVANAVKGHLDRKRTVIATLKSIGATGADVFAVYLAQVIGPFGQSFLMPNHPKSHIVMICTGTGSAPMRAMTEWRRRLRKGGKFEGGKLMLFFGARTREGLLAEPGDGRPAEEGHDADGPGRQVAARAVADQRLGEIQAEQREQ